MKNKRLLLRLIANDCGISTKYINDKGDKTCAVGAMALAAGVTKAKLRKLGKSQIGSVRCASIAVAIMEKFDLTPYQLTCIQQLNDFSGHIEFRRSEIIIYLETIS